MADGGWMAGGWRADGGRMEGGWRDSEDRSFKLGFAFQPNWLKTKPQVGMDGWMDGGRMEGGWRVDRGWMEGGWMVGWMDG